MGLDVVPHYIIILGLVGNSRKTALKQYQTTSKTAEAAFDPHQCKADQGPHRFLRV